MYYKTACHHADQLQTKVAAMQAALMVLHGISGSFKRRPAEQNGQYTWMEVYQAVPPDFEAALEQAVERAGLNALIDGARHIEQFVEISPCA